MSAPQELNALNRHTGALVDTLVAEAQALRLQVSQEPGGARLIDAGIQCRGGLEAGRRVAEICMAGLGRVRISGAGSISDWPTHVHVYSLDPVTACLGSQYAGWSLAHGEGKGAFHALGSGPGRILARREPLFDELSLADDSSQATLVLEVDKVPPRELVERIAADCGIALDALNLILTPTASLAGTTQVVARVLEVALHKAHELHFPLDHIVEGMGSAPLPPPAPDFIQAMGRTNDAILFGGQVQLFVEGDDEDARELAEALPSSASRDYGRPFAEIFKACGYDFFQIDPMLFSPARVTVSNLSSGRSFRAGAIDRQLLAASFGVLL